MNKLNNLDWIKERIRQLIILRRESSNENQKQINVQLSWLYDQKFKLLKEQKNDLYKGKTC